MPCPRCPPPQPLAAAALGVTPRARRSVRTAASVVSRGSEATLDRGFAQATFGARPAGVAAALRARELPVRGNGDMHSRMRSCAYPNAAARMAICIRACGHVHIRTRPRALRYAFAHAVMYTRPRARRYVFAYAFICIPECVPASCRWVRLRISR